MMTRTGPQRCPSARGSPRARSRPSLRTDRLITDQVTSTVADLLDLHQPARRHPRPRTGRVEPDLARRPWVPSSPCAVWSSWRFVPLSWSCSASCHHGLKAPAASREPLRRESMNGGPERTRIPGPPQTPIPRSLLVPGKNLTREEAATRADLIAVHSYDVVLDLTTGPTTFATRSTVRFSRSRGPGDLHRLRRRVRRVGHPQRRGARPGHPVGRLADRAARSRRRERARRRGHRASTRTPARACTASSTRSTARSTSTRQFEVPDSRRMFAVFEQPDLKATFAFTVTAPAPLDGRVRLPHARADARPATATDLARRRGPSRPTPVLSSYVTALVAGPYVGVRDEVQTPPGSRRRSGSSAASRSPSTSTPTTSST